MKLGVINHWYNKKSAVYWNKDGILRMLRVLQERDGWEVKCVKKHERTCTREHDSLDLDFSTDPSTALWD